MTQVNDEILMRTQSLILKLYIINGILLALLLVENRVWLQYTRIDDVIESYARFDWLKCFNKYIKQLDSIFSVGMYSKGRFTRYNFRL